MSATTSAILIFLPMPNELSSKQEVNSSAYRLKTESSSISLIQVVHGNAIPPGRRMENGWLTGVMKVVKMKYGFATIQQDKQKKLLTSLKAWVGIFPGRPIVKK